MPTRLEFLSYSIVRRNPDAFKRELRAKYPTMSVEDLERVATVELWKHKPRLTHTEVLLFGRDVDTDDLTTVAGWDVMSPKAQRHLKRHQAAGTLSQAVSIDGLSRTYVFNKRNDWVQEVADADLPRIRASTAKHWFRDYDRYGPWAGFPQTWQLNVVDEFRAPNKEEAARFVADVKKTKQWPGRR